MERLMLWIARNKNTTVDVVVDDDDDLSSWEIINPSHQEETDNQRPRFVQQDQNEEPVEYDLGNNAIVVPVLFAIKSDDPILTVPHPSTLLDQRSGFIDALSETLVTPCDDDRVRQRCRLDEYHQRSRSRDGDDDDDVDYDYEDNRFGNQRMGKVGKKVNRGMMKKSKKLPRYFYNKMA